jgi:hypothetical protein
MTRNSFPSPPIDLTAEFRKLGSLTVRRGRRMSVVDTSTRGQARLAEEEKREHLFGGGKYFFLAFAFYTSLLSMYSRSRKR